MSGIYIPGMEMPDTCFHCKFNYQTMDSERSVYMECCFGNGTSIISRPPDCPLIAVPDHGRLIDADSLVTELEKFCKDNWVYNTVSHMPTIIQAEEDGE